MNTTVANKKIPTFRPGQDKTFENWRIIRSSVPFCRVRYSRFVAGIGSFRGKTCLGPPRPRAGVEATASDRPPGEIARDGRGFRGVENASEPGADERREKRENSFCQRNRNGKRPPGVRAYAAEIVYPSTTFN